KEGGKEGDKDATDTGDAQDGGESDDGEKQSQRADGISPGPDHLQGSSEQDTSNQQGKGRAIQNVAGRNDRQDGLRLLREGTCRQSFRRRAGAYPYGATSLKPGRTRGVRQRRYYLGNDIPHPIPRRPER